MKLVKKECHFFSLREQHKIHAQELHTCHVERVLFLEKKNRNKAIKCKVIQG